MKKILLAAAVLAAASFNAAAQYPSRPIRIIVPFQAGGTSEVMARAVGDQLTAAWKQSVVIENRPGGGTTIGAAKLIAALRARCNNASALVREHVAWALGRHGEKC